MIGAEARALAEAALADASAPPYLGAQGRGCNSMARGHRNALAQIRMALRCFHALILPGKRLGGNGEGVLHCLFS
jgi:hypothetical protein